ncbi:MAG TPA: hypothetical protein EYO73_06885, partial [Sulfurimonas sp.]|nr:hypothetical protein [Sulfurimonas sp.]
MYKLFFLISALLLFLSGCGGEPTPEERKRQVLLDNLQAGHIDRFKRDGSYAKKIKRKAPKTKGLNDPSAYVYKNKVLGIKEEKKWKKEKISNKEYPFWAGLNIPPSEATIYG